MAHMGRYRHHVLLPLQSRFSRVAALATSYQAGAIAAMALGLGSALVFGGISYFKIASLPVHFSLYGFFIALGSMIVVSLLTRPHSEEVLNKTMTGWYIRKVE